MTKHILAGIRPDPLASYLAGLGIIRVLGEQAGDDLAAWWDAGGLVVETTVDDLVAWFTDTFVPTPVLRAWNPGSGFGQGEDAPSVELRELLGAPSARLDPYRATLRAAQEAARTGLAAAGWSNDAVVREFRNLCPQEALPWIDAAAVMAGDQLFYPPLLGTGGNDGRFDFAGNLHTHLIKIFEQGASARRRSAAQLRDLFDGTQSEALTAAAVGQFDPAAAGGRNSSPFGAADSIVNPWGFVLLVEGAMMFAATAARRHLHDGGRAAIPFTVRESPEGSPSGARETSRGELWAPVWDRPFTYLEVRQLFSEARAAWRGRPAQQAVEFYAATRTLGVARGISSFVRYGIHQRNGQAHVAVPIERVAVESKPAVALVGQLDEWVRWARRGETGAAVGQAVRAYDKAQMAFARDGGPGTMGRLLAAVTSLEIAVGRSGRARETVRVRQPPKAGAFLRWLAEVDEPELRVAVGLASCRTVQGSAASRTMRQLLLPIDPGLPRPLWRDAPVVAGFGVRRLGQILAEVLAWRARTAMDEQSSSESLHRVRGIPTFWLGVPVPDADLHSFALGQLDEDSLNMWLKACLALDWRRVRHSWPDLGPPAQPIPLLGMLHAIAVGIVPSGAEDVTALALEPDWPARLTAGRLRDVYVEAARRLCQAGLRVADPPSDGVLGALSGVDIAAALVPRCRKPRRVLRHHMSTPITASEEPNALDIDVEDVEESDTESEERLS